MIIRLPIKPDIFLPPQPTLDYILIVHLFTCQCWALNVIGFVKQLEMFLCSLLFVLHEGSDSHHSKIKASRCRVWHTTHLEKQEQQNSNTTVCLRVHLLLPGAWLGGWGWGRRGVRGRPHSDRLRGWSRDTRLQQRHAERTQRQSQQFAGSTEGSQENRSKQTREKSRGSSNNQVSKNSSPVTAGVNQCWGALIHMQFSDFCTSKIIKTGWIYEWIYETFNE